jgi:xanthine dehydrogenase accessory factor
VKRAFLRLEGEGVPSALIGRVHAPIGLNVGAQTPEEIAIAIAAELVAERRGHPSPPGSSWWRDSG